MIYPDHMLQAWAESGGVDPYDPACVNPASIDLRWSGRLKRATIEGWEEERGCPPRSYPSACCVYLQPGKCYLMDTLEYVRIPDDAVGLMTLKSSMGRLLLEHLHSGFFDPGFHGTASMELQVVAPWPVTLHRGQRIVQLTLIRCISEPTNVYDGKYQGQTGPTEAR